MQRKSERSPYPGKLFGGFFRQRMSMVLMLVVVLMMMRGGCVVVAAILRIPFRQIVMMEMKETLQKKHHEKSTKRPCHAAVERMKLFLRIR